MDEALLQAINSLIETGGTLALWAVIIIKTASLIINIVWASVVLVLFTKLFSLVHSGMVHDKAATEYRLIINGQRDEYSSRKNAMSPSEIAAVAYPPGWTRNVESSGK